MPYDGVEGLSAWRYSSGEKEGHRMEQVKEIARPRWEWLKMQFENKIKTGAVLQLAAMLSGFIFFLLTYEHRITVMESSQQQIERRLGDQESQMRTFQNQIQQLISAVSSKRGTNEFGQLPPP